MNQIERVRVPLYEAQAEMVRDAVAAGQLALGPHLETLEQRLCNLFGKRYAVLTSNGFSALLVALRVLGRPGAAIATPPIGTCFALTNAIMGAHMQPLFVDVGMETASVDALPGDIGADGAVVPDHFGIIAGSCKGRPPAGPFLIEDAAQAFLSRTAIAATSDAIVLSFYPTKVINGIDGGAILTDDEEFCIKARSFASYADQAEYSEQPGYNMKLANLHAAFALGTLEHLDEIRSRLRGIYVEFADALRSKGIAHLAARGEEIPWRVLAVADNPESKRVMSEKLRGLGVATGVELMSVCPPDQLSRYPIANALLARSFSIPFYASLTDKEVAQVTSAIASL